MCECNDFRQAEKAYRRYAPELKKYRSSALDDAMLLSLKAGIARGRRDYGRSEALFREVISVLETRPDAVPADLGSARSNLALVLNLEGRSADAFTESSRAIEIFERIAPAHSSLIPALTNRACALAALGLLDEAKFIFRRVLYMAEELYGEDNYGTAIVMLNYATVLRKNNEVEEADRWYQRGAAIYRRALARSSTTIAADEIRVLPR